MKLIRVVLTPLIIVSLLGCSESKDLSPEITSLKDTVKQLEENISTLQTDIFITKVRQEQYDTASFDPAKGKGYGKVETISGYFLISLIEVTPYLDGVKVKLHIGNTQSATYSGFTISADYGRRYPMPDTKSVDTKSEQWKERRQLIAAYQESKREKKESFTQVLRPGTWNVVYMILPDIKPENFGRLNLSMVTNEVRLTVGG